MYVRYVCLREPQASQSALRRSVLPHNPNHRDPQMHLLVILVKLEYMVQRGGGGFLLRSRSNGSDRVKSPTKGTMFHVLVIDH